MKKIIFCLFFIMCDVFFLTDLSAQSKTTVKDKKTQDESKQKKKKERKKEEKSTETKTPSPPKQTKTDVRDKKHQNSSNQKKEQKTKKSSKDQAKAQKNKKTKKQKKSSTIQQNQPVTLKTAVNTKSPESNNSQKALPQPTTQKNEPSPPSKSHPPQNNENETAKQKIDDKAITLQKTLAPSIPSLAKGLETKRFLPDHPTVLPHLYAITSRRWSFLNFIRSLEIIPLTPGSSLFQLRAEVFEDGSLFLAQNPKNLKTVEIQVIIGEQNGEAVLMTTDFVPIQDLVLYHDQGNLKLFPITTQTNPPPLSLSDFFSHGFTLTKNACQRMDILKDQLDFGSLYNLTTACATGYGYKLISSLKFKAFLNGGFYWFDSDGQAVTDIVLVNGQLQFVYGVNGVTIPLRVLDRDIKKIPSFGSQRMYFDAMKRSSSIPNAANGLTNTPTFYNLIYYNFDFLKSCQSLSLTYQDGEDSYQLKAKCANSDGTFSNTEMIIRLTGQNGVYRISDAQGQQLSNIVYKDQKLTPIYTQTPNRLTLVGRKFSIFNPYICMQNTIRLQPKPSTPHHFDLIAECENSEGLRQTSQLTLKIDGQNGIFDIRTLSDETIVDIVNQNGILQSDLLERLVAYDYRFKDLQAVCQNLTLITKDKANKVHTLSGMCPTLGQPLQKISIDLQILHENGSFALYDTNNIFCQKLALNGQQFVCQS